MPSILKFGSTYLDHSNPEKGSFFILGMKILNKILCLFPNT